MPLHDWKDERGWDGVHLLWLAQMLDWIQPRLPPGFRAYVGAVPALTLEAGNGKPNVTVRGWRSRSSDAAPSGSAVLAPDRETVATFTLDPQRAIHVDWHGQLIAAVEVVSPRNKDRLDSTRYTRRYLGYLRQGVHLMLIDVFSQPPPAEQPVATSNARSIRLRSECSCFSFADAISADLGLGEPATPPPSAISYRMGGLVPRDEEMGTQVALWCRLLGAGQPLPELPLPLDEDQSVVIDLEKTYHEAARRVYLD